MADQNDTNGSGSDQQYRLDVGAPVAAPNPVEREFFTETERVTAIQKSLGIEQTGQWDTETNKAFTEWLRLEQAENIGPGAKQSDGWWGKNTEAALKDNIDPEMFKAVSELHASGRLNQLQWRNEYHNAPLVEIQQAQPAPVAGAGPADAAPVVDDIAPAQQPMPDPAIHMAAAAFVTAAARPAPAGVPLMQSPASVIDDVAIPRPPAVNPDDLLPSRPPQVSAEAPRVPEIEGLKASSAPELPRVIDAGATPHNADVPHLAAPASLADDVAVPRLPSVDPADLLPNRAPDVITEAPRPVPPIEAPSAPAVASLADDVPVVHAMPATLSQPAAESVSALRETFEAARRPPSLPAPEAPRVTASAEGPSVLSGEILDDSASVPDDLKLVGDVAEDVDGIADDTIRRAASVVEDVAAEAVHAASPLTMADDVARTVAEGAGLAGAFAKTAGFLGRNAPLVGVAVAGTIAAFALTEAEAATQAGMMPEGALAAQVALAGTYTATGVGGFLTASGVETGGALAYDQINQQFGIDPVISYMTRPGFMTDLADDMPLLDEQQLADIKTRYSPEAMAQTYADIRTRYGLPETVQGANGQDMPIEQAIRSDAGRDLLQREFTGDPSAQTGLNALHFAARAESTGQYWLVETAHRAEIAQAAAQEKAFWDEHQPAYDQILDNLPTAVTEDMPPQVRDLIEATNAVYAAEENIQEASINMMAPDAPLKLMDAEKAYDSAVADHENMYKAMVEGGSIGVVARYMHNQGLITLPEPPPPEAEPMQPQRQAPLVGAPVIG